MAVDDVNSLEKFFYGCVRAIHKGFGPIRVFF